MRKFLAFMIFSLVLISVPAWADGNMGSGRKSVTSAGTAEALVASAQPFTLLTVCADPDNTGKIAVGKTPVASTTIPQGVLLGANDCYTIERTYGDVNLVKIDSTVSGESVTFEWQYR